jgi:hypothetical protein
LFNGLPDFYHIKGRATRFVLQTVHKLHVERRQKCLTDLQGMYAGLLAGKLTDPGIVMEIPRKDLEFEALGNAVRRVRTAIRLSPKIISLKDTVSISTP